MIFNFKNIFLKLFTKIFQSFSINKKQFPFELENIYIYFKYFNLFYLGKKKLPILFRKSCNLF